MEWHRHIDAYCERTSAAFWAEPTNAVTNAAFVLAALAAIALAWRRGELDWPIGAMVAIMMAVGVCSFLFHTVAEVWAALADTLSIQVFIVFYFAFAMRRFAGLAWWLSGLATVAFMAGSQLGGMLLAPYAGSLNGSEGYIPPLLALVGVGALLVRAGRRGAGWSLIAGGVLFAVSLTFRTIDMAVCPVFPLGTHFIWHTLNGILLGFLVIAMARFGVKRPLRRIDRDA